MVSVVVLWVLLLLLLPYRREMLPLLMTEAGDWARAVIFGCFCVDDGDDDDDDNMTANVVSVLSCLVWGKVTLSR